MQNNVLIVVPHTDDESIAMGGTIKKHIAESNTRMLNILKVIGCKTLQLSFKLNESWIFMFEVNRVKIGKKFKPYIIAELSANHGGDRYSKSKRFDFIS